MEKKLIDKLKEIKDNRADNRQYELWKLLYIKIVAVLAGYNSFNSLNYFLEEKEEELKKQLTLTKLPSSTTIYRAVAYTDQEELEQIIKKNKVSRFNT